MPFQPQANQELAVDGVTYHVTEHPGAPGIPYGQEGRQAIVYQLAAQDGDAQALKVFKPRYRLPALVGQATKIAALADLPGLQVCRRTVLSARRNRDLLRQHPDLTYATVMPWVKGPTWMEVMLEKRELTPEQSLELARSLAEILATMEEHGLAHCDLSGPNVLLPSLAPSAVPDSASSIQLVDVEQIYSSDLKRPELLPGGSPGYAHKTAPEGMWGSTADRFSGAALLGEMLGWCDARVREAAWGENYFDPHEMQRDSDRYETLVVALQERWGDDVTRLFERAWRSEVLADCATFGEWLVTLPEQVPVLISSSPEVSEIEEEKTSAGDEAAVRALMEVGRRLEERGNLAGALENYRQAQTLAPEGSSLAEELRLVLEGLDAGQDALTLPARRRPLDEGEVGVAISTSQLPDEESKAADIPLLLAANRVGLDALFDDGLAAYCRGEWAEAKELLTGVVKRQPNYVRDGQKASDLLEEAEERTAPSRRHVPGRVLAMGGLAAIALVVGLVMAVGRIGGRSTSVTKVEGAIVTVAVEDRATPTRTKTPIPSPTSSPSAIPTSTQTPSPTRTPTLRPTLPSAVSTVLSGVDILYYDDFSRPLHQWEKRSSSIVTSDGLVEIPGKHFWDAGLDYGRIIREDEGVLILFKYDPGAEFEIFLYHGEWGTSSYRRWGIYAGRYFGMNVFKGSSLLDSRSLPGNLTLKVNTWYYLLLAVDESGGFVARVWEKDDPARQAEYRQRYDDDWMGKTWGFSIGANEGTAYFDAFTAVSFNDIK